MGARVIAARHAGEAGARQKTRRQRRRGLPAGPFDKAGSKALADLFKKACGETGADVIYDPVGGDYSEAALRAIGWEGRFLVVGFPAGIPKAAAQPDAAQVVPGGRRVLGRVHPPRSRPATPPTSAR
jgi:NADPH2:quinone reductase